MVETITGLSGRIISRKCPLCGHHEIGLETEDGSFHPLRQGMLVQITAPSAEHRQEEIIPREEVHAPEETVDYVFWIPEPVASEKRLRLKYGVRIRRELLGNAITPELYRLAYLDKLTDLIEKEVFIPIPVILDRFFTAPNLASGNPRQIAEAMWGELKEVRAPFYRVEEWLRNRGSSVFEEEFGAGNPVTAFRSDTSQEEDLRELDDLSFEDFLALL